MKFFFLTAILGFLIVSPEDSKSNSYIGHYWVVNEKGHRIDFNVTINDKKPNSYHFFTAGISEPCFIVSMLDDSNFKVKPVREVSDGRFFYEYKGKGSFQQNAMFLDLEVNRTVYINGKQHNYHYPIKGLFTNRQADEKVTTIKGPKGESIYKNKKGGRYYYKDGAKVYIK